MWIIKHLLNRRRIAGLLPNKTALVLSCLFLALPSLPAQESPVQKPTVFLDKNRRIVDFQLKRLSNEELLLADRATNDPKYIPVYEAILLRDEMPESVRKEAVESLMALKSAARARVLMEALQKLAESKDATPMIDGLAAVLFSEPLEELRRERDAFESLAFNSDNELPEQIGWAGLLMTGGAVDVWNEAADRTDGLPALLKSMKFIQDAEHINGLRSRIVPLIQDGDDAPAIQAALSALGKITTHRSENFRILSASIQNQKHANVCVQSILQIPEMDWPESEIPALADGLLKQARTTPLLSRSDAPFQRMRELFARLTNRLPEPSQTTLGQSFAKLVPQIIEINTVPEQMLYDRTRFAVEKQRPVLITLNNRDAMQHNLVVAAPGKLEAVGTFAETMAPLPDKEGRLYVPDSPDVLWATRMLNPHESETLGFMAPQALGEYPFVCTFPGHWRRMNGRMIVVDDVEAYLAAREQEPAPTMIEWTADDFQSDLEDPSQGRNINQGRELFTQLACVQCHVLGGEGLAYGPDLTDVFERYDKNRRAILEAILNPSLNIDDRYRNYSFELKNGETTAGMILSETEEEVQIQSGPSDALIQSYRKSEITEREPAALSLMPAGLLNSLTREQVLDLMWYLETKQDPIH